MRDKIKHHPIMTAVILMAVFYAAGLGMGIYVNLAWWSLAVFGLILYILCFVWHDSYELVCPQCNQSAWDKTRIYCSACGVKLVFRNKQKVKPGEKAKPDKVLEPCCSKGHRVYGFDKYCGKCGEKLQ